VPVDELRLLAPERVGLGNRAAMEFFISRHLPPPDRLALSDCPLRCVFTVHQHVERRASRVRSNSSRY
jgi:hypothetical protein